MTFLTAGESVESMARYCRIEQMLFGLLGTWSVEVNEPTAKVVLLTTSDHCAWRAKRWFEMLPTAPPGPDSYLAVTSEEREAFDLVVDLVGTAQSACMTVTFELLLPALRQTMTEHLDQTTAVADGPVQRMLAIAITDIENDLLAGIGPMELSLALPEERERAQQIEAQLSAAEARFRSLFRV